MSHADTEDDLLYAILSVQLGLVSLEIAQEVVHSEIAATNGVRAHLVRSCRVSPVQDQLVAQLVDAYLEVYQDNSEECLKLFKHTPVGSKLLGPPDDDPSGATVSLDGSQTNPRPVVRAGGAAVIHQTASGDRFRKIEPVAAGGIGEVSLARDEQLRRHVALKQLKEGFADDPLKRERFIFEGEITGTLEHPGIVPVYALGVDALGRPFYAMRLIRGETFRDASVAWRAQEPDIGRYRRDSLMFRRLLTRFIGVCQALEYAHSRGVIHRDIKPDNIMLGAFGETYLVDWGMARVMGDVDSKGSLDAGEVVVLPRLSAETQYGSVVGTPAYMSPEQASARLEDVGIGSDVYSLGATLYFLLAGQAPYVGANENPLTIINRVIQGRFAPPCAVQPGVPRELNAICCRAMALKPSDRYESAAALGAEIERYLADDSVDACRPTILERLGRWTRKHRSAVLVGGFGVVAVAVVSLVAALLLNESRRREQTISYENLRLAASEKAAHQKADERFLQARETVDKWLAGYSEALQAVPLPGVQAVRQRMLELAAEEYEAFVAEKQSDPSLQLEQGRTYMRLGSIYRLLGRSERASDSLQSAQASLRALLARIDLQRQATQSWALAKGMSALVAADSGQTAQAEAEFAEAITALERFVPAKSGDVDLRIPLVTLWTNRGGVLAKAERHETAKTAFDAAIALARQLVSERPADPSRHENLAIAEVGAGQVQLVQGDAEGACQLFEAAAQVFADEDRRQAPTPQRLQLAATAVSYLAAAHRHQGNVPSERAAYEKAADLSAELCELQPEAPGHQIRLAMAKNDLGQLTAEQFEPASAVPLLRDAAALATRVVVEFPAIPEYREVRAAALINLAQSQLALGHWLDSLEQADLARTEFAGLREAFPDLRAYRTRAAVAESTAAQALFFNGDREAAWARFAAAVELLEHPDDMHPPTVADREIAAIVLSRYGDALYEKRPADAAGFFARAAEQWNAVLKMSGDARFAQGAAWFLAASPAPERNDAPRALQLVNASRSRAEDNPRLLLTLAVVEAIADRPDACLAAINKFPEILAAVPCFEFARALAYQSQDQHVLAREAWQTAAAWTDAETPGDWDLVKLKQLTARRLKISDEPPAVPR